MTPTLKWTIAGIGVAYPTYSVAIMLAIRRYVRRCDAADLIPGPVEDEDW